jgi:hypothetical protein
MNRRIAIVGPVHHPPNRSGLLLPGPSRFAWSMTGRQQKITLGENATVRPYPASCLLRRLSLRSFGCDRRRPLARSCSAVRFRAEVHLLWAPRRGCSTAVCCRQARLRVSRPRLRKMGAPGLQVHPGGPHFFQIPASRLPRRKLGATACANPPASVVRNSGEHRALSMLAYVWRRTRDAETGADSRIRCNNY